MTKHRLDEASHFCCGDHATLLKPFESNRQYKGRGLLHPRRFCTLRPGRLGICMNTILATGPTPTKSYGGARLHRIRTAKGYEFVVRVLGSGWFLTLALVATQRTYGYATAMRVRRLRSGRLALAPCELVFGPVLSGALGVIILRPSPAACDDGVLPSFTAFVGTYLPWTIVLFVPAGASSSQNLASAALLLIGSGPDDRRHFPSGPLL